MITYNCVFTSLFKVEDLFNFDDGTYDAVDLAEPFPCHPRTCKHCGQKSNDQNPLFRRLCISKGGQRLAKRKFVPWSRKTRNSQIPDGDECYICWVVVAEVHPGLTRQQGFAKVELQTWGPIVQRWCAIQVGDAVEVIDDGAHELQTEQSQALSVVVHWDFWPLPLFMESFPDEKNPEAQDTNGYRTQNYHGQCLCF